MKRDKRKNPVSGELLRISRLSMEAAEMVLPAIRDENLKFQVERQREGYRTAAQRSAEILRRNGIEPAGDSGLMERVLRSSIKTDTLWNKSTSHIAQIAIHCTEAAMKDLVRTMDQSADDGVESQKLAEEFLDAGQKNIEHLKGYL